MTWRAGKGEIEREETEERGEDGDRGSRRGEEGEGEETEEMYLFLSPFTSSNYRPGPLMLVTETLRRCRPSVQTLDKGLGRMLGATAKSQTINIFPMPHYY